jgi:hypothetical protein
VTLSKKRVGVALTVAIAADVLQFPLTAAFFTSILSAIGIPMTGPIEAFDLGIDLITAAIQIWLLGFHWVLLPTIALEALPFLDLAPTWTACVLWVIRARRKAMVPLPNEP